MRKSIIVIVACLAILSSTLPAWADPDPAQETPPAQQTPTVGEERQQEKKATQAPVPVEQGGALLPFLRLVIEPSFEYDHISSQNVSLSGFTIFEAVLIGQVSVQKLRRDIFIPGTTIRLGLKDAELNVKLPYYFRTDELIFPRSAGGTNQLVQQNFSDQAFGDIDSYLYYHVLNEGKWRPWVPDVILRLGGHFPTGRDPYHLPQVFDVPLGSLITTQFPTGTGHWGTSLGATLVKSADPAVLFLNLAYYYNFHRDVGTIDGNDYGDIKLGNSFEYSIGLIFALNEHLSMNFSLDQRIFSQTLRNGVGLVDTSLNAITFNIGATYVVSPRWTVDFVVGLGLSQDVPNVTALLRVPISFQF
jgi:hypothetical protein